MHSSSYLGRRSSAMTLTAPRADNQLRVSWRSKRRQSMLAQRAEKGPLAHGLFEEVSRSQRQGQLTLAQNRADDGRDLPGRRVNLECLEQLPAIALWHQQIKGDRGRSDGGGHVERANPVG